MPVLFNLFSNVAKPKIKRGKKIIQRNHHIGKIGTLITLRKNKTFYRNITYLRY